MIVEFKFGTSRRLRRSEAQLHACTNGWTERGVGVRATTSLNPLRSSFVQEGLGLSYRTLRSTRQQENFNVNNDNRKANCRNNKKRTASLSKRMIPALGRGKGSVPRIQSTTWRNQQPKLSRKESEKTGLTSGTVYVSGRQC